MKAVTSAKNRIKEIDQLMFTLVQQTDSLRRERNLLKSLIVDDGNDSDIKGVS